MKTKKPETQDYGDFDREVHKHFKIMKDFEDWSEMSRKRKESTIKKIEILDKYHKATPKNQKELKELYSILCWNSPGYCCHPTKGCFWCLSVLDILDIPKKKFTKEREEMFSWNAVKGKWNR